MRRSMCVCDDNKWKRKRGEVGEYWAIDKLLGCLTDPRSRTSRLNNNVSVCDPLI